MKSKFLSVKWLIIMNTVLILLSSIFAIIVHALMPASADITDFDSILVKWFGFPAVATFYFIILFTQCALAVRFIGARADVSKFQIGIRFGISFAMIYILGMQEVVIEGSPFSTWGLDFVKYQFINGIGDGIPAVLLCFAIAYFTLSKRERSKPIHKLKFTECLKAIVIFAIAIFTERAIGYQVGIITSDIATFPVQCYIWTGLLGILIGYIYVLLYPLFVFNRNKTLSFIVTIGLNWMIFNIFIGLIMKGTMPQMVIRSGLDIVMMFVASIVVDKYIFKIRYCTE